MGPRRGYQTKLEFVACTEVVVLLSNVHGELGELNDVPARAGRVARGPIDARAAGICGDISARRHFWARKAPGMKGKKNLEV